METEVEEKSVWKSKSGLKIKVIRHQQDLVEFWDLRSGAICRLPLDNFLSKYIPLPSS